VDPEVIIAKAKEVGAQAAGAPAHFRPIATAPMDNRRLLYLARFDDEGKLAELDFDGIWECGSESRENPQPYYFWASANGIEEPTHWAFQDEPMPAVNSRAAELAKRIESHCWDVADKPVAARFAEELRALHSGASQEPAS
jgi:hypothetical protein